MNQWTRTAAVALLVACGVVGGGKDNGTQGPGGGPAGTGVATGTGSGTGSITTGTSTGAPNQHGPLDLITPQTWPGLRVRIDYVAGHAPDPAVLDLVESELGDLLASGHLVKPGGIELVLDDELPEGDPSAVHTFQELNTTLGVNAGPNEEGDFVVIHALWTDGGYEGDSGNSLVLGFAYGTNRMVMLADNIEEACDSFLVGPLGAAFDQRLCEVAEATVFMHELGHLFGLVNNGLPMVSNHQDEPNGAHDIDSDCLMYHSVERSTVFEGIAAASGLGGPQVKDFDPACLEDLAAAQAP